MKLLLIDDDSFLLDMYTTKFQADGYEVDVAKNAERALEKLRSGAEYDVILLDMVMPGMSGEELIKKIVEEKLGGTPKCIVLSNQSEQQDIDAAHAAGAAGYIIKAETIPSEVVAKINEYMKP